MIGNHSNILQNFNSNFWINIIYCIWKASYIPFGYFLPSPCSLAWRTDVFVPGLITKLSFLLRLELIPPWPIPSDRGMIGKDGAGRWRIIMVVWWSANQGNKKTRTRLTTHTLYWLPEETPSTWGVIFPRIQMSQPLGLYCLPVLFILYTRWCQDDITWHP